jgi:hypothetical protein
MAIPGFEAGFAARSALFGIDGRAQDLMRRAWPIIAPHLEGAIAEILAGTKYVPQVDEIVRQNWDSIRELELTHFRALFGGDLDERLWRRAGGRSSKKPQWASMRACEAPPGISC